ncbi:Lipase [Dactylellina cionopaga]|nr:Lipase [Dactylellina cionopaga]
MSGDTGSNFPTQYINFQGGLTSISGDDGTRKTLTFIGASAVSLLCYEKEADVAKKFQGDSYHRVRHDGLVSAVWPLATTSKSKTASEDTAPLIAWSERLQVLYLGFRGTQDINDIITDIDIRRSSVPSLAALFHAGFLIRARPYSELIKELARKYSVVICGHSLGGAMATLAAYLAIAEDNSGGTTVNTWQNEPDAARKLSVVTFGSPAMMVLEPTATTASLPTCYTQNFHHIINRDDIVP